MGFDRALKWATFAMLMGSAFGVGWFRGEMAGKIEGRAEGTVVTEVEPYAYRYTCEKMLELAWDVAPYRPMSEPDPGNAPDPY